MSRTLPMSPSSPLVFGRVPHPPVQWRVLGPDRKPSGWSRLGPRRVVGTCVHRMEGTLRGTEQHFLSDDPHGRDALTDYGIGGALDGDLDGVVWGWLRPEDDRSPWANGPADHLEGDGPAFVRAHGVAAVNRDLRSIELSGRGETPVTPRQLEALARLVAHVHDAARVPWHAFPVYPESGAVTQLQHWEFAAKGCPGPVLRGLTDAYQERARAIMGAAQTGLKGPSLPPPSQVQPKVPFAAGQDLAVAAWQFGSAERVLADGSPETHPGSSQVRRYRFDAQGVVSNAWLERAQAEDAYPAIAAWRQFPPLAPGGTPREAVRFANGWTLWSPAPGAGWFWLGRDGRVG